MAAKKRKRLADPLEGTMTVSQAAERLGAPARKISDLLYELDPNARAVEIVGRRRRIVEVQLDDLRQVLINRGVLAPPEIQV